MKLTRLFRIIKIFKKKMVKMFKKANKDMNVSNSSEKLVFFFVISFLIVHVVACMWVFVTQFVDEGEVSWIMAKEISQDSDASKYLSSMYFTVTTFTTVGYGDILSTNPIE